MAPVVLVTGCSSGIGRALALVAQTLERVYDGSDNGACGPSVARAEARQERRVHGGVLRDASDRRRCSV